MLAGQIFANIPLSFNKRAFLKQDVMIRDIYVNLGQWLCLHASAAMTNAFHFIETISQI